MDDYLGFNCPTYKNELFYTFDFDFDHNFHSSGNKSTCYHEDPNAGGLEVFYSSGNGCSRDEFCGHLKMYR